MDRRAALVLSAAVAAMSQAQTGLRAREVVSGLSSPVAMIQDPTDATRKFIVQQGGLILVLVGETVRPTPFLDLSTDVVFGGEQGLLGLAFPRDYATSGKFYVNFTRGGPFMQLAEFRRDPSNPERAQRNTRRNILATSRPFDNHNAGCIHFGPDGYLYVPTGDGGSGGDPDNVSQNPQSLLGKMLRIDPSRDDFPSDPNRNYGVPASNPFSDGVPVSALPEIWAFGLRNPWKFSFDDPRLLGTGAVVVADVGQGSYEEVNYVPPGPGGQNFGWKRREGDSLFSNTPLAFSPDTRPALTYGHSEGQSVTGGYVYRGLRLGQAFFGRYFFADYVSGRVWSCKFSLDNRTGRWMGIDRREHTQELSSTTFIGNPSAIEADSNGELFIVDYQGRILSVERLGVALRGIILAGGRIVSGGARHLVAQDQKSLVLAPVPAEPRLTSVTAVFSTVSTLGSTLGMEWVGRVRSGAGLVRFSFRRWSDGAWVQVRAYRIDTAVRRFRATDLGASTAYVRGSDGRIEMRATVELDSGVTGAQTEFDYATVTVG